MNFFLKLFKLLSPELAHSFSLNSLKLLHKLNILRLFFKKNYKDENVIFLGMHFKNRLGTAAGLDKNGDYIDALGDLGFGFLEVGTVTPLAQSGNPKPRVFRNYRENSIINRLGFNNKGVDYLVSNLKKKTYKGVLGVNIGANKDSIGNQRINDYLVCLEKVNKYADYITINISSPNTPNLRDLHDSENLSILINAIDKSIKDLDISKPVFLKISPDESDETISNIITHVEDSSFSGIIATNTTIDKSILVNEEIKLIDGGISGEPLMNKSTEKLSYIRSKSKDIKLIGVGGVLSKEDYDKKINAGASLVQVYTGFIIQGPKLINNILNN
ncbi:MAG: dihydroorotate dehydrogenase (quinone) [Gammaproteobacteria bacterium]|nr:dihydroorotate dehydrogenase (quinone) [Gammaproteobacteria bacterium]